MSQRMLRVNELLRREISHILHTRYQSETVDVTIVEVESSPNLREARVYYALLNGELDRAWAEGFFNQHGEQIRREVGKSIVLKFLPKLEFLYDDSAERAARLNKILDELGLEGEAEPDPEFPNARRDNG